MARIFTTEFIFNHQKYDAIVTIFSKDGKVNFAVKVMDLELQEIIPNGVIEYEGKDGFEKIESLNNTLSQAILRSISRAIETHLTVG
ncbi:MAG TPA: hypothetical protein VFQ73_10795 [Flavisolibacter sp.]|nr:hypothetical protein [Flavisolibacter sp.]